MNSNQLSCFPVKEQLAAETKTVSLAASEDKEQDFGWQQVYNLNEVRLRPSEIILKPGHTKNDWLNLKQSLLM